jgi:hypothetical protein
MRGGFIGRDRELAELLTGLEGAIRGEGAIFLLAGEPGIGKTTLAERLASHATGLGARVVWSRSWEGGDAAPYWMWAQIVRALLDAVDEETLRSFVSRGTQHIALLAPELADRFGAAPDPVRALDSDAGRFYLFEATARLLKHVSSTVPLVLILDDFLAGDRPSLRLLRFIARDIRAARILVVATYRDVESGRSSEAVEVLAELVREGYVLDLRGFDESEVGRLIAEESGVAPWHGKVAAIHQATGGNPLFVREVTRLLATVEPLDQPRRVSVPVPDSVRAVIRRRLAPLSTDAMQALSAAAVVGRDFDLTLVGAACDLPPDRILASVADAVALGVVAEASDTVRLYRFTHPLMREAIYDELPIASRTQMHQRVGAALERLYGTDSASHLGELAYHFARAAPIGECAKACDYATRAGDRAMDSFAYEQAVAQYRRALDALALSGQPDPALRCELLLRLGRAQARAGDYIEARATCLLAGNLARELDMPGQLARAALGFGEPQVEGGLVDRQLVALLEEAIDRLGSEDSALRVRIVSRLSLELTFADEATFREERRPALSNDALRAARRLRDVGALAGALRARWLAVWGPDGLEERTVLADEILHLARDTGDREIELFGRARRITCSLEAGDGAAAVIDVTAHARLAEELRMPYHEWAAATMRAGRALLAGSFDRVERLAQDAADRLPGRPNAFHAQISQLTMLRWEQGRLGELHAAWQGVFERFPQFAFARGWLCLAAAQQGRNEAARGLLRQLVAEIPALPRNGIWLPAVALASLAAAQLDRPDDAAALYPLLLPFAERTILIPMPHPAICFGSASLYLALLAAASDARDEAEQHFDAALRANQRLGAKPLLARTRCEYARMLLRHARTGDRRRALDLLEQAETLARAVGMPQLIETIGPLRAAAAQAAAEPVRSAADTIPDRARKYTFHREGEYWTIAYRGPVVRLRDTKGMRCLARLLASPGQAFAAVELEAWDADAPATVPPITAASSASSSRELDIRSDLGDAGELLDARARTEYSARLDELRAELDEAERFNDSGRAARASEELDFLTRELARAVGLGGRGRRAASHAERARLNVTRAIRASLRALARVEPALGQHLAATIHTGRFCSYTPDPHAPHVWET